MHETNYRRCYSRARLLTILCIIVVNSVFVGISLWEHHYPLGSAAILFLIPCLQRELDMRSGRPPRRVGAFEWSCFLAGVVFLAILPFLI